MVKEFKQKILAGVLAAMVCPQVKESITGYSYEPWHFRYVGQAAAQKISAAGVVLEEYVK